MKKRSLINLLAMLALAVMMVMGISLTAMAAEDNGKDETSATQYAEVTYSFKKVDQFGDPVAGAEFYISVSDASGTLWGGFATSDEDGMVTFDTFHIGTMAIPADITLKTMAEVKAGLKAIDEAPTEAPAEGEELRWNYLFDGDMTYEVGYYKNGDDYNVTNLSAWNNATGEDYRYSNTTNRWCQSIMACDDLDLAAKNLIAVVEENEAPVGYESLGTISGLSFALFNVSGSATEMPMRGTTDVVDQMETIDIPVTKVWDDSHDQDEVRPEEVTIDLYANGEKKDTITLNEEDYNWKYTFEDLPKYEDGEEIEYSVKEETVAKYTSKITGSAEEGFTVTNTHKSVGDLIITKTVNGNDADYEKEFDFTVTLGDTSINGKYGDLTFKKGVATFSLASGGIISADGLPHGVSYTVTEADYTGDGYVTTSTGATGTIVGSSTVEAEFTNTRNTYGDLVISKTVAGNAGDTEKEFHFDIIVGDTGVNGTYGDVTFENGFGEFTLKDGETAVVEGLANGVTYIIEEDDYSEEGYQTEATNASGIVEGEAVIAVDFTNTRNATGDLAISKTVAGNAGDTEKEFHFNIVLGDPDINGTYGDITFENGFGEFTLKDGETVFAEGLPNGVAYAVTEDDYSEDGYVTTFTGEAGVIEEGKVTAVEFTNTRDAFGKLTVSKTVAGNAGSKTKEFTFNVVLSDATINGTYGDMTFENGAATFTLKDGQSKTAENLPVGVTYSVTEADYTKDGYVTTKTGESGTIEEGKTAEAKFTNTKNASGTTPKPNTGDGSNIALWLIVCGLALAGIAAVVVTGRRKAKQ